MASWVRPACNSFTQDPRVLMRILKAIIIRQLMELPKPPEAFLRLLRAFLTTSRVLFRPLSTLLRPLWALTLLLEAVGP